jgi:hypothetical protein
MEQSGTICRRRVLAAVVCLTILLVPEIAAAAPAVKLNVQDAPVARQTWSTFSPREDRAASRHSMNRSANSLDRDKATAAFPVSGANKASAPV